MESQITFTLSAGKSGHVLDVRIAGDRYVRYESHVLSDLLISKLQENFRSYLIEIDRHVWANARTSSQGNMVGDFSAIRQAQSSLCRFTNFFLNRVFGPEKGELILTELRNFRDRKIEGLLRRDDPVAKIDYKAQIERFLPIEYLFLDCDRIAPEDPSSLGALQTWLRGALGLAFDVRRIPGGTTPGVQNSIVIPCHSGQRLGILFYPLECLSHEREERAFLRERNPHVFQTNVCTLGSNVSQATTNVARSLGRKSETSVYHFACHFAPVSTGCYFELGHGEDRLWIEVEQVVEACRGSPSEKWVAFVNACESGGATTFDLGGLVPDFFNVFGASCFIGPEHKVQDPFAFEFARVFYANWLRYRDLSLSLFKTRRFLVKRFNYPLALFYACFATGNIRLEGKRQHVFL